MCVRRADAHTNGGTRSRSENGRGGNYQIFTERSKEDKRDMNDEQKEAKGAREWKDGSEWVREGRYSPGGHQTRKSEDKWDKNKRKRMGKRWI
jgi:hypothetical protein